MRDLFVDSLRD